VVTSFEFRLHALGPEIMTAQIFHPGADAARVLRCYRDFMNDAPDEVAVYALCVPVPPADPFPEAHHGKTAIALIGCHAGGIDEGRQAFAPLTEFGDPLMSSVAPMPYRVLQDSFTDGAPNGGRYYWKSHYMNELSDAAIDVMAGYATALPGPFSNFFIEPLGGAIQRVAADATAFPHRGAAYSFGISSGWAEPDGDESGVQWTRAFHDALAPHASGGFYINYLDHDESMHVESAYGDNYARLLDVKARYDPDDLFRLAAH
jgi:FAD/FMN-containing dehydrogenase